MGQVNNGYSAIGFLSHGNVKIQKRFDGDDVTLTRRLTFGSNVGVKSLLCLTSDPSGRIH